MCLIGSLCLQHRGTGAQNSGHSLCLWNPACSSSFEHCPFNSFFPCACGWLLASPFRARNNAGGSLFNGFSSSFTGLTLGFVHYFVHLHITILLVTWPKTYHLIGVCTVSTLRSFHLSHFSEYIWLVLTLPSEQPHSVPVFFISCCCLPARKIALLCLQARSV